MNNVTVDQLGTNRVPLLTLSMNLFIFMGLACFTLSLFMPVFLTSAENIYGYWVLATGWLGMIFIQFAWYANPLNLLALLIARDNPRIAILLSTLALVLASGTVIFHEIPVGLNHEKIFIKEYGLGFYIWYIAQVFFLLSLFFGYLSYRFSYKKS